MKTREEIIREANKLRNSGEFRYGQAVFNVIADIDSDFAYSIAGTENDPFYNNKIVPRFLELAAKMNIIKR